jgi:hypothetical protein
VFLKEYMSTRLIVRPKDGTSEAEKKAWRGSITGELLRFKAFLLQLYKKEARLQRKNT